MVVRWTGLGGVTVGVAGGAMRATVKISKSPSRLLWKATVLPSGDQVGCESMFAVGVGVRSSWPWPSEFIR